MKKPVNIYWLETTSTGKRINLIPEAIALCPVLSFLTEEQLRYIIITYDYIGGPYSQKPESERSLIAITTIYGSESRMTRNDIENNELMISAIDSFKSLIYDTRKNSIDRLKNKLSLLEKQLAECDANDFNTLKNITSSSDIILKQVIRLEKIDEEEEEKLKIRGDKEESMIEKMKRTRKLYAIENKGYVGANKS